MYYYGRLQCVCGGIAGVSKRQRRRNVWCFGGSSLGGVGYHNVFFRLWMTYRSGRGNYLFRVPNIRFSNCSDGSFGCLTQVRDIRHPWLKSRSRQRPVAELLGFVQNIKKI